MDNILITGGTSGIGYELAKIFAKRKYNVMIVSSSIERLKTSKQKIEDELSVSIKIYEQDLSQYESARELYKKVKSDNINIDILINNAGFGLVGPTEQIDFQKDEDMMVLNMITLVNLCKLFLSDMYKKSRGKILNIGSIASFMPGPYSATYFASKAFVLSYSKAIRFEAAKKGVQICTVCPGPTISDFHGQEGLSIPPNAKTAEEVAEFAYHMLIKNKSVSIPGMFNKLPQMLVPESLRMKYVAKLKG